MWHLQNQKISENKKKDAAIDKLFEHYGKECEWNEVLFYINRFYADIRWIYSISPKQCDFIYSKIHVHKYHLYKVPDFV